MKLFKSKLLLPAMCLLAIAGGMVMAKYQSSLNPPRQVENATVFSQPRALPQFELLDHRGSIITTEDLKGAWSIVFFGFSHCPDVCPTTLSMLARTNELISDSGEALDVQVYMISVDPERDTVEKLASYVPFFDPSFIGVTGSTDQINALTKGMGVAHNRVLLDQGDYTIDHTSALFLLNPEGHMAALSSSPHQPQILANDLLALADK